MTVLLGCFMGSAWAQVQETSLDSVDISATRLSTDETRSTLAITVVDKTRLQQGNQQLSINESLGMVPGLFALNADNFSQDLRVSIRGFGARSSFGIRGVKVLVDGIPESTPDGQAQVDNIDMGLIQRMQVISGPASGLYGNAAGGVIYLESEDAPQKYLVEGRATIGSYNFQRYQLKAGFRTGKFRGLLYGARTQTDGYRDHSRMENTFLNGRFSYQPGDRSELTLLLNYINSPIAQDPGGVDSTIYFDMPTAARDRNVTFAGGESVVQGRVALVYKQQVGDQSELRARGYFLTRDFANRLPFGFGGQVEIDRLYMGGGVSLQHTRLLGNIPFRSYSGLDIDYQADDRRRYMNEEGIQGELTFDQLETFLSMGIFTANEFQLTEDLLANITLRFDALQLGAQDAFLSNGDDSGELAYQQLNPTVGLSYSISPLFNVYGNVSTSFETPVLSELSTNPNGSGGFNPDLQPQRALNMEVGTKGLLSQKIRYAVATYYIRVTNELVPYELGAFPEREFFRNAGSSNRIGAEVYVMAEPVKNLTVTGSYTFNQFTYREYEITEDDEVAASFNGNFLPGIPQHIGYLGARYGREKGFYANGWVQLVGSLYTNDSNSTQLPGYTVINLRAGWILEVSGLEMEPYLGANNLLNTLYPGNVRINAFGGRFFEAAPGQNFFGGLRVRVGK